MIKKIIIGAMILTVFFLSCQNKNDKENKKAKISITDDTFRYEDDTILNDLYEDIKESLVECDCS